MTWKQLTVIRILLMIAGWLSDEANKKEVRDLANHISVDGSRLKDEAI